MGGASSYLAILAICGFLSAAWVATKLSKMAGISSIVAEIATGVILGPRIVGLISDEYAVCVYKTHTDCLSVEDIRFRVDQKLPLGEDLDHIADKYCKVEDYLHHEEHHDENHDTNHEEAPTVPPNRRLAGGGNYATYEDCLYKTCQSEVSHHCGLTPDVFTLIGHTGVALMIFESGMHFDFDKAQIVGPKACVVAVFGTLLPFLSGTILMALYGYPMVPDGVAVGTALAPTSVGIALRLLGEAGVLQHDFGQAIITAAFVDDILSLVLFNVLFSLTGGGFNVMTTVVSPIVGVALMILAMYLAVKFWPNMINNVILPKLPQRATGSKLSSNDEGLFMIMLSVLIAYGTITHFLGTHLWGCFIAGMSFACIDQEGHIGHTHHVWVRQTKRYTSWMIRIFFACTVAFSIPIAELLSIESFLKGSIMGIGPCVLTKVLCAPCMGNAKWVIGWAMVGRAEFAYLIAQMGYAGNMIDEKTFSICIWALLYATILAPFIFRVVLNKYIKSEGIQIKEGDTIKLDGNEDDADDAIFAKAHQPSRGPSSNMGGSVIGKPATAVEAALAEGIAAAKAAELEASPCEGSPAKVDRRGKQGWWGGRQATPSVAASPNGFLCCLFYKKQAAAPAGF